MNDLIKHYGLDVEKEITDILAKGLINSIKQDIRISKINKIFKTSV